MANANVDLSEMFKNAMALADELLKNCGYERRF